MSAPTAPFQGESVTSYQAALALDTAALSRRHKEILHALRSLGPMTDGEIQQKCAMHESTERPRRIELVRRGLVVKVGTKDNSRGRACSVWAVAGTATLA